MGTALKDWEIQINYGIKTGFNGPLDKGGCFLITKEKRDELIEKCPKAADIIRPILRGRDIQKYQATWSGMYLITTHTGYTAPSGKQIPPVSIDEYPFIKQHLNTYWPQIQSRLDQGITPYHLRSCIYMDDFSRPKIVWKRIGSVIRFSYDETGAFGLDSTCFLTGKDIKFLTGYLNSTVCRKQLLSSAPKTGTGDIIISVQALEPLKIPNASEREKHEISLLVDSVIQAISNGSIDSATKIMREIDRVIFKVLEFTSDEIKFIES